VPKPVEQCKGIKMINIRKSLYEKEKDQILHVINRSFLTVAIEFGITKENAPTNPAFIDINNLDNSVHHKMELFVAEEERQIIGCVGIQPGKSAEEYYIERLSVLPEHRHKKVGERLLQAAIQEIRDRNIKTISIGIVDENKVLKDWYLRQGFLETGSKKFDHLPFTVCFMIYLVPRSL
jgi:N-acetylglutamate synthase-like GNAT family acetyltransferase